MAIGVRARGGRARRHMFFMMPGRLSPGRKPTPAPTTRPAVLGEDVEGLASRFGSEHHGLGKLSGDYRADKKTVAAFTRDGVAKDDAHQYLGLAVAWKQAAAALAAAEAAHAAILGAYYTGGSTDWSRLSGALTLADTAVRAAGGQDLARAADLIGRDAGPDPVIARVANDTVRDLNAWHAALAPRPKAAARPELMNGTITDAIGWLRAHLGLLHAAAAFTHEVSQAVRHPLTARPGPLPCRDCGMRQMPRTSRLQRTGCLVQ